MIRAPINAIVLVCASILVGCTAQSEALALDNNSQENSMSESPFLPGLVYSEPLAGILGLPLDSQTSMQAPLLGAALDLSVGISGGHVCQLHMFMQEDTDIRLPPEPSLRSIGASSQQLPYAFIKKPNADLKKLLGNLVGKLANRVIIRFGRGELSNDVIASEDKQGSYVSLPLNEYNKQLFPGVMWFSTPINCALAAETNYDTVTVFFENTHSPLDMIINQSISPEKMGSVNLPLSLFNGMREDIDQALAMDDASAGKIPAKSERFRIIGN